ncbi:MAG TPA: hypothetical protein VFP94_07330 [Terriglobales bacterium]|nr:hypothetical protein [Terriglobales bacterium]
MRMRTRASLISLGGVLLLAWLAFAAVSPSGANPFVVQVPAEYLSVGQQFQPRLVSLATTAVAPEAEVTLDLRDAGGHSLTRSQITLDPTTVQLGPALSLPRAGNYTLRASLGSQLQTISLHALPAADPLTGGVLPIASLGVAPGIGAFLRQHAFAVEEADLRRPTQARIIMVQPRLSSAAYTWLWQQVEGGAQALVLEVPPPAANEFWPVAPPLVTPPGACLDDSLDPLLLRDLSGDASLRSLLQPPLTYDFAQESQVNLYHWDGRRLARPNHRSGYDGCHPLISYRYGDGWVTLSSLPLLQHFQDVRARVYLMNLLKAVARRKPWVPPSPGLAWILQQRMAQWPAQAPIGEAVYYRQPPSGIESAPVLVPLTADGNRCWVVPATREPGATITLELGSPRAASSLSVAFAPGAAPPALRASGTSDGRQWVPLPEPAPSGAGQLAVALPHQSWQELRVSTITAHPAWKLCRITAQ